MNKKLLTVALLGKTNAGKSTLINSLIGEKISIINKKINTTQESIIGIKNIDNTQIVFYDTPGSNFLKTTNLNQKHLKINIWQAINSVDIMIYLVDVIKYNFKTIKNDINKLLEVNQNIILVFNKTDLIENIKILPLINELKSFNIITAFFNISAKLDIGTKELLEFLLTKSYIGKWKYTNNEITDKDDIYITNECTRNAILDLLHKEIPYNVVIKNDLFKNLKNKHIKIKQLIQLNNIRHKAIILGKNGNTIKRIREKSQIEIQHILQSKVHLYLYVDIKNEK